MLNRYLAAGRRDLADLWCCARRGRTGAHSRYLVPAPHAAPYSPRALRDIRATAAAPRYCEARRDRLALAQGAVVHRVTIEQITRRRPMMPQSSRKVQRLRS